MLLLFFIVGVVIIVSGLCSLCEAILYSVPFTHIESLIQKGRSSGKILKKLRKEIDAPITAILSLNTIANTAGATLAGAIAVKTFGAGFLPYFSLILTLLILFFSEVIPKTTGVVFCRSLSSTIAWPLQMLVVAFRPIIWLCRKATKVISSDHISEKISIEELVGFARLSRQTGIIDQDKAQAIENILSLGKKSVREVVTPRTVLFALEASITVSQAQQEKDIFNHSRIPIYVDDFENIIGIVHRHDIINAVAEDHFDIKLKNIMKSASFILESTRLDKALKMLLEQRQQLLIVLGEFGDVIGVITLEDILEEILGKEIVDEFDKAIDMQELARLRREKLLSVP